MAESFVHYAQPTRFFISNFSRDIQAAVFNAAAEADIEGGMLNSQATITRMLKLVPKTLDPW